MSFINLLPTTNKYNEKYQQQKEQRSIEKIQSRLSEKYRVKPFALSYYPLNRLSYFVSILFNVFSICTATVLLFTVLQPVTGFYGAILIGSIIPFILELVKRQILPRLIGVYFQFKKVSLVLLSVSAILVGLSIALSYEGGKTLPSITNAPPVLVDIDSIHSEHNSFVSTMQGRQDELKKITYRGKTTRTAQRSINGIQSQINSQTAIYTNALKDARTTNIKRESKHTRVNNNFAFYFSVIALLSDLGLLVCIAFLEYYDYRSAIELSGATANEKPSNDAPSIVNENENNNDTPSDAKEVEQTVNNDEPIQEPTATTETVSKYPTGECRNCKSKFEKKNPRKVYCSTACRQSYWESTNGKKLNLST